MIKLYNTFLFRATKAKSQSSSHLKHFHSSFSPFLGACLIVHKKNNFDAKPKLINVNSSLCSEKQFPLKNSSK